jgi:hypothetical protein
VIIPIDSTYRVAGDALGWSIERAHKRKGAVEWRPFRWFGTLPATIRALGELMVRTGDTETLADALVHVHVVCTTLSRALAPEFELKDTGS